MTKSRVCVERAAKLAKQACVKKTNLLVYEKSKTCKQPRCTEPKSPSYVPPISSPKLKHIRICTGSELKRMCPPKTCDCPPKTPFSLLKTLQRLLGFGLRSAIAFGLVYITVDLGIWGDSERTEALYKSICEMYSQETKTVIRKNLPGSCQAEKELFNTYKKDNCDCYKSLPIDHERGLYDYKQKWNKAVYTTFSSLAGLPNNFVNYLRQKFFDGKQVVEMECELEGIVEFDEEDESEAGDDGCKKCH